MGIRILVATLKREDGFTLMELLVALSVLVIGVLVAWSALMTTTVKTTARVQEQSNLQTEVRAAVDRLAADLRQAQCDTTTTPRPLPSRPRRARSSRSTRPTR